MDQTAFRELLARRRDGPRPQKGVQGYDDDFGQHNRPAHATSSAEAPVAMRPRTVRRSDPDAGAYMDRAEARRRGLAAEVPREHKGLDLRLLAEQKAKMRSDAQRSESPREHPGPDAEPANEREPGEPLTDTPQEPDTTEQDLEAALDEGRHRPAEPRDVPKFRPLQPAPKPVEPAPAPPAPAAPDVIYVNGKRMRRKKKVKTAVAQPSAAAASGETGGEAVPLPRPEVEQEHSQSAKEAASPRASTPTAATASMVKPVLETPAPSRSDQPQGAAGPAPSYAVDAAEDDDIFGEADEWQGIPADSDSDAEGGSSSRLQGEEADLAPPPGPQDADAPREEAVHGHRDWFAPTGHPEPASPSPEPERQSSSSSSPPPQRLEGLSSSALPSDWSRWLLEREEKRSQRNAQQQPAQRKRKRSKKGKGDIGSP